MLSAVHEFVPFSGIGYSLPGKKVEQSGAPKIPSGTPDFSWQVGTMTFIRKPPPLKRGTLTDDGKAPTATYEGGQFTLGSQANPNNKIEHPPPDFDPSDESPAKKKRLDATTDLLEDPLDDIFLEESDSDMEVEMED